MESILFSKENGIATITLNRPDKYNSVNKEIALGMQAMGTQMTMWFALYGVNCIKKPRRNGGGGSDILGANFSHTLLGRRTIIALISHGVPALCQGCVSPYFLRASTLDRRTARQESSSSTGRTTSSPGESRSCANWIMKTRS